MGYISEASEAEYTGDCYNRAVTCQTVLLEAKALIKSAGFRILQSGDGNAILDTSGDCLDNTTIEDVNSSNDGTSGHAYTNGSLGNNRSWFIVAPPVGAPDQMQLCIQTLSFATNSLLYLRVKASCGGFATATLADTTPGPITPGDEQVMEGDGTDASPVATSGSALVNGPWRMQAVASDDASEPFFAVVVHTNGDGTKVQFALLWDTVDPVDPSDTYTQLCGYLTKWGAGNVLHHVRMVEESSIDDYVTDQGNGSFVTRFGSDLSVKVRAKDFASSDALRGIVGNLGANTVSGLEALRPMGLSRSATSPGSISGFKGLTRTLRWCAAAHEASEELNLTAANSREWCAMQDVAVPWGKPSVAPVP